MESVPADRFFDLIVIGSGPAALALVTRILEQRPAALYTEEEHVHLHWLKRKNGNLTGTKRTFLQTSRQNGKKILVNMSSNDAQKQKDSTTKSNSPCDCDGAMRILVVDKLGAWMANWDRLFKAYEIPHLRSPMFFHPAPSDLDALVAYAQRTGCSDRLPKGQKGGEADLIEITGCVGKEISKHKHKQDRRRQRSSQQHTSSGDSGSMRASNVMGPAVNERERKDYFTPSTRLFREFCQKDLVERYNLHNDNKSWPAAKEYFDRFAKASLAEENADDELTPSAVQHVRGEVKDLDWTTIHVEGWDTMQGFCVELNDNIRLAAKAVVCATGPGATPGVPEFLTNRSNAVSGPGWCHSTQIGLPHRRQVVPSSFATDRKTKELVVIGGGLTSAQLCDVAIRKDANVHCTLIIRRHLQVKPFDVGLQWVGRYANLEKMTFWQESDPQERLCRLRQARNGGSITPRYAKLLRQYEQQGRLTIMTCTNVEDAQWTASTTDEAREQDDGQWTLNLCTDLKMAKKQKMDVPPAGEEGDIESPSMSRQELTADYIIAATGAAPQLQNVPFMQRIRDPQSVAEYGGLPFVTEDLQYGDTLPLFFTGAFSALQIGPGAFNLEGMRAAADRIAIRLQEIAAPTTATYSSVQSDDGVIVSNKKTEGKNEVQFASNYTHFAFNLLAQEVEA